MVNYRLKECMIEAVNNQLRENNPKDAKEALNRLIKLGYAEEEAKEMIAAVLIEEMYDLLKNKETYNEERYTNKLSMLPEYFLEKGHNEDAKDMEDFENIQNDVGVEEVINSTIIKERAIGRNELCICGSGKKYKKCCGK